MKRSACLFVVLAAVAAAAPGRAGKGPSAPAKTGVRMTLTAEAAPTASNDEPVAVVRVENRGAAPFEIHARSTADLVGRFRLTVRQGKTKVPYSRVGRSIYVSERPPRALDDGAKVIVVRPHSATEIELPLSRLFDISLPGTYRITGTFDAGGSKPIALNAAQFVVEDARLFH